MMAVGKSIHRRAMARAVTLELDYTIENDQLVLVDGILGLSVDGGDSGDSVAIEREPQVIDIEVPAALYATLAVGDKLYVVAANVTGHTLNDDAYTKTATANLYLGFVTELLDNDTIALAMEVQGH